MSELGNVSSRHAASLEVQQVGLKYKSERDPLSANGQFGGVFQGEALLEWFKENVLKLLEKKLAADFFNPLTASHQLICDVITFMDNYDVFSGMRS
ncbi:MAG: hypothetical protein EZS28_010297 [Streblomastix strix]|uniref:Uncharacterized protein n=1 Tax=Streblomastix strix TaxID=222440 RepID=A0A5J4WH81_9EUKA|nr:MAG: hypothetical protein EZS28_010297 [Streblomastix strix]